MVKFQKAGENGHTAGPIETKLCAIHSDGSGNGYMLENIGPVIYQGTHVNPRLTGGNIRGFRGSTFHRKSGYDLQEKKLLFTKIKFIN